MTELLALLHNPYVIGSLGLSAGSLLSMARGLPRSLSDAMYALFTVSLEVSNGEDIKAFEAVRSWVGAQPYAKRTRNVTAVRNNDAWLLTPAPGNRYFFFEGRLVRVNRSRDSSPGADHGIQALLHKESLTIRILSRDKRRLERVLNAVTEHCRSQRTPDGYMRVYTPSYGTHWEDRGVRCARPVESVVLPNGDMERITDDLDLFWRSEDRYREAGIPYRRGWLLYGTPGTGKTSVVSAIAGQFKRDIYILSLSGSGMTDANLLGLVGEVEKGSIILLEDIDAAFEQREGQQEKGVTFSGLLNVLDGITSPEGSVVFMTTNHIDKLDPALIRPGRIDRRLEFRGADLDQIERLHRRLAKRPPSAEFIKSYLNQPLAKAQVAILGATPS